MSAEQNGNGSNRRVAYDPLVSRAAFGFRARHQTISDLIIASLTLALLSPSGFHIALLIKLDSKGPVYYAQERVGMDGRIFVVYKFRTMHVNADSEIHREYQRKFIAGMPRRMSVTPKACLQTAQ